MKCLTDIKLDIIDKIREDLLKGGLFSYGFGGNRMITNKEYWSAGREAGDVGATIAIQKEIEKENQKIADSINRQYKENLVKVENNMLVINPSDELAQKYLNQYNQTQTDTENIPFSEEQRERGYEIDNTGPNTEAMLSPLGEETLGVFEKFIRHKERLKKFLENKLSDIAKELKNPKTTTERRTELNDLKLRVNMRLNGEPHRMIIGLTQEIADLRKNANIDAIGYYVEQDLARLKTLVQSNNASDIKEARTIIDFYDAAGTFQSDRENPFFPQDQIFFFDDGKATPDYQLGQEMMNQFKRWRDTAMGFAPAIDLRAKEVTVSNFNADLGVQKAYGGKEFNHDAIVHTVEGLKDVDWVSAWAMDVTQAIFSKAAPLAQVMHSHLVNAMEGHLNYSREYAKAIEELTPKVTKRLSEIEGGKYKLRAFGILGLNGVSYDLFLDTTKNGLQTGTLVQRFTKEFVDAQVEQGNKFSKSFEEARLADDTIKPALYNAAFEANKQWKRANTIMMNPALVEELADDPEFSSLQNEKTTQAERQAHKKQLVDLLGEKGYNQEVEKQKNLLHKFMADRQSYINAQMVFEGVTEEKSLSPNSQFVIKQWDLQHSPMMGVKDYHSSDGIFIDKRKVNSYMDYNNTIPRSKKVTITSSKGLFHFEDNATPTGFYNERYKTIEQDEILSEFYDLVKQGLDKISESAPYELQKAMPALTLPMLMKSTTEFLMDNRNGTLKMVSSAWRRMWDRIRLSFGLIQQSEISYAVKDPITGKYNYKVNDQFLQGNQRTVKERSLIEKIKFLQAYNIGKTKGRLEKINRFTAVPLSAMNTNTLAHLAQLLNVDISSEEIAAGKIDKISAITGPVAQIGKIIRDFSVHNVVQAQSFDLPKLMKHFTNLASAYAARTEALPVMEIMKAHYEQIRNPKTNNTTNPILNMLEGRIASEENRKRANEQMENWFQRVMLDNYGIKHSGVFGGKVEDIKEVDEQGEETGKIKETKIPLIGKKIYSTEEKKKIKELNELINKEEDAKVIAELQAIKEGLGKTRTASAAILNFLDAVRTLRLGWSLSSGVSNFAEGYISNMIIASGGEFFDPKEIYFGYSVGRKSWIKNISFGKRVHPHARKARILMDRYNVLLDSKNELQKATVKTNLSRLESLNPYEINARIEYLNQMPILVAMLRSQKVRDKNGNEASIWDAMNSKGEFKEEFKTEENINNWEKLVGNDYLAFKNKMNEAIVRAHGNYDELRGMMLKSNLAGKAIAMFKTWLPMQIFWRFGQEQVNLKTGKKFKGRYRSFTPGSGTVYGAGIGLLAFGLGPMALIPAGIGLTAGHILGLKTDLGAIRETALTTAMLFKKALGMPINIIRGRNLIDSSNDFNKWIGQGKFTELDARNLRGNMAELSIMMTTLALMLLVKGMFWDDDDDKESAERQFHNIAVNKLMQLASQATMYVKPTATWKSTFGDIAVLKYLEDVGKEMKNLQQLMLGTDPGGTKTWRQTKKTFIPGMFKDLDLHLGFGSQAEKQFEVSPYDDWFHGEEFLTARKEKQIRKNLNEDLKEAGYDDEKQRLKILNMEMPTTKQLNKKGYSREEWEEELKDWERPEPEVKEEQEEEQ